MIGTRGHDIGGMMSPEVLAQAMAEQGFEAVQLVAYRSIMGVSEESGYLTPGLAYKVGHAFNQRGIHVALIGSYFNLLHPDEAVVAEGIKRFKEYIRHAKDFRGNLVGTETGSYNSDYSYNPENNSEEALLRVIEIFKELVGEAKNHGVMVGIEGLWAHAISTPKRMKRVLDAVDSGNLQVIFDPVNLLHIDNYKDANNIIDEAFELYGDRIILIHAKDFVVENNELKPVPIGQGLLDYKHLFDLTNQYKPGIEVIIEDVRGEALKTSQRYLETIMSCQYGE